MQKIFEMIDGFLQSFMQIIFEGFNSFWESLYTHAGQGAYLVMLLIMLFLAILILIGLIKIIRKFGLFIFMVILLIGIPVLWFLLVLPSL